MALSLDEGLLGSWSGPFGWMVIAEPLRPGELRSLAEEVGRGSGSPRRRRTGFPSGRWRRSGSRNGTPSCSEGLRRFLADPRRWRAAADEASAARVAGLFCASAGLGGLPYALSPAAGRGDRDRPRPAAGRAATASRRTPFYGSTELLAALARPPEAEVPGVRFALRPDFDVTPEAAPGSAEADGGIQLGEVLDRNLMPAGPFALSARLA